MDSFDDFEFKPLTEGLGFHKKNSQNSGNLNDKNLPPLEPRAKSALDNLKLNSNSLNFDAPQFDDPRSEPAQHIENKIELPDLAPEMNIFSKPLPRTQEDVERRPAPQPASTIPKFNSRFTKPLANPLVHESISKSQTADLLKILEEPSEYRKEIAREKIKANKVDTTVEVKLVETSPAPLSLFLDMTVISGLAILFMLGLVVATNLDIIAILNHASEDVGTQSGIALLIYSVSQLYLILFRSFFGQTLGEWSMDMQLGQSDEQDSLSYIFKLIARTSVLALTGFIILPLASMFLGTDIAGRATGLKLYRK